MPTFIPIFYGIVCQELTRIRYVKMKFLRIIKAYVRNWQHLTLYFGGGDGIRTHGTVHTVQRFSKPSPSATRPPLRKKSLPTNTTFAFTVSNHLFRGCQFPFLLFMQINAFLKVR